MGPTGDDDLTILHRRYDRERKARAEAEAIAERVTSDLYASQLELKRVNEALSDTNAELQKLNQSLRDFVAVASHDLRSPLTAILGWASTIRARWAVLPEAKKVAGIEAIVENGHRLERLVDDLLTISTIESGALETRASVVRFREAMESVIRSFADKAVEIRYNHSDVLAVIVDESHLQRILSNYVGNAFKYGAPPVDVEAAEVDDWVEIRVRDLGPGVPEEFVPRLFGKFSRAEDDATRSKPGTGLGLSIVKGLVTANGGETWYEPNKPHGSCFVFRLKKAAA